MINPNKNLRKFYYKEEIEQGYKNKITKNEC
jgi:hypothetical protein